MAKSFERLGDTLLSLMLPRATAAAQCSVVGEYCVDSPDDYCGNQYDRVRCFRCPGSNPCVRIGCCP